VGQAVRQSSPRDDQERTFYILIQHQPS